MKADKQWVRISTRLALWIAILGWATLAFVEGVAAQSTVVAPNPAGNNQLAHASAKTLGSIRRFLNEYHLGPHLILFVSEEDHVQDWQLDHPVERYIAGPHSFVVDPQTGAILEFGLGTTESYETPSAAAMTPRYDQAHYDQAALQVMARTIVFREAKMNVLQMELESGTKGDATTGANTFFRWWGADSGSYPRPFIQVGLTQSGQLINFVNAGFYEALTSFKTVEEGGNSPNPLQRIPSPNGEWIAELNSAVGSLNLTSAQADKVAPFPPEMLIGAAIWSPDSKFFLALENHWQQVPGEMAVADAPATIWRIRFDEEGMGEPEAIFQPAFPLAMMGQAYVGPTEISWGSWSPDGRHLLFWFGPNFGRHDGHQPWVLNVETGEATQLADSALPNPRYQSWSPDGSLLAISAGGYRSAQTNKWLNLYDSVSGSVTTVISSSEQIAGIVAWSPKGDKIAYAAVPTALTGPEWNDWMSLENPAIAGRRIYLLDVASGKSERLNALESFQDAPLWQAGGKRLYYVQQEGDTVALVWFDPATSKLGQVAESMQPMPHAIGYYGQFQWDNLLAYAPDAPRVPLPQLTERYTNTSLGFTFSYPAGWYLIDGWQGTIEWRTMPTLIPPGGGVDLAPFSARLLLTMEPLLNIESKLESLLADLLKQAGPGQILDADKTLLTYHQEALEIDGHEAVRLDTLGEFGEVNHLVLVMLDDGQGLVLRGAGDGALFDAIVATLRFTP